MIGRLTGALVLKDPPLVMIDANGVGYEIDVPMSTFYDLPALGERVCLLTHMVVREDAQLLYGFLTENERTSFRQLIRISGVGPRTALSLLSGLSVEDLAQAVAMQEAGRLTKVPGIGKKTAERLLLELKGKLTPELLPTPSSSVNDAGSDVVRALLSLGYSEKEARLAVRGLDTSLSLSDGIKLALKALART